MLTSEAFIGIANLPIYGANVANRNLPKGFIEYSSLDEIHLLYDSLSLMNAEEEIRELLKLSERASRLKLKNIITLPSSFREGDYLAFHQGDPFWGKVARLRTDSTISPTGTAYVISYHSIIIDSCVSKGTIIAQGQHAGKNGSSKLPLWFCVLDKEAPMG